MNSWNVAKFLQDYHIPYQSKSSGFINVNCPFGHRHHGEDIDFFGGFSTDNTAYVCWSCGGMPAYKAIAAFLNIKGPSARDIIEQYSGTSTRKKKKIKLATTIKMPGEDPLPLHKNYLQKRGFDIEYLTKKYGLKFTGQFPEDFKYRVIIPITHHNKIISYQGRTVCDDDLRYKVCPISQSKKHYKTVLYGADLVDKNKPIIVVEGIFDAWRINNNAVATFGTSVTNSQIKELSEYKKSFILFDSTDAAGQEKAKEIVVKLRGLGKDSERLVIDINKDPGDFTEKEVQELRDYIFRE